MYLCQECGEEVAVTLLDPCTSNKEVCEECFENLQKDLIDTQKTYNE